MNDLSRESTQMEPVTMDGTEVKIKSENKVHTPIVGFLFFGIVGLLCFNFFLQVLFNLNAAFSGDFSTYAGILYGLSNNCGQLLIIFFGSKFTFSQRVFYSSIGLSVVLLCYPALAALVSSQSVGLGLGLFVTFLMGFLNAIIQSAGFGLAGVCSAKALEYFSVGQALSGLLPWPLMMLLKLIFKAMNFSDTASAGSNLSPLAMACTITSLAIAALATLAFAPYYKFRLSKTPMVEQALANLSTMKDSPIVSHRSKGKIIKDTLPLALSVWFVLYVTFVVFPNEIFNWSSSLEMDAEFFGSLMIYVYQVFDVVGRYLVSFWRLSPKQTKIGCAARGIFIPLFFLSTFSISLFASDITRFILMALFAAANGFLLTWCMIHGPGQVHKDEADVASYTMSFFLVNGIFFGSLTAMAFKKAVQNALK